MENKKHFQIRDTNFINIQYWMVSRLKLSASELLIYAIIYGYSQDGTSSFNAGYAYLAAFAATSRRTAIRVCDDLEKRGLIIKKTLIKDKLTFNCFSANPVHIYTGDKLAPATPGDSLSLVTDCPDTGDKMTPTPVTSCHPIINRGKEKPKERVSPQTPQGGMVCDPATEKTENNPAESYENGQSNEIRPANETANFQQSLALDTDNDKAQENPSALPGSTLENRGNQPTQPEKKQQEKPGFDALKHLVSLGVSEQVANDYLSHRKLKKAQVTPTVIRNMANRAAEFGYTLEEALIEVCLSGWTGFHPKRKRLPATYQQGPGLSDTPYRTCAQQEADSLENMLFGGAYAN